MIKKKSKERIEMVKVKAYKRKATVKAHTRNTPKKAKRKPKQKKLF